MAHRPYDLVRDMVEKLGGQMLFNREGTQFGAWIITLGGNTKEFIATGKKSIPDLDQFYVPSVPSPKNWNDYKHQLIPHAEAKLYSLLNINLLSPSDEAILRQIINQARWKFSWTLARTYPHEYTTKSYCDFNGHAQLIDFIEGCGKTERFGNTYRKYLYFEERRYWHMGDPYSDNPDEQPNVINRSWVDVKRHAENVKHVWTEEEVELQTRIWEIQLEKKTDLLT